jgi:hypothetical protein
VHELSYSVGHLNIQLLTLHVHEKYQSTFNFIVVWKNCAVHENDVYYALKFVRPIASLKSYHVTIQQSPVSDPPTE